MTYFNLKAERTRRGLTQAELADKLNCHVSTVNRWEQDISGMPVSKLNEAATIFECSTEYLLDRTNDRLPHPV